MNPDVSCNSSRQVLHPMLLNNPLPPPNNSIHHMVLSLLVKVRVSTNSLHILNSSPSEEHLQDSRLLISNSLNSLLMALLVLTLTVCLLHPSQRTISTHRLFRLLHTAQIHHPTFHSDLQVYQPCRDSRSGLHLLPQLVATRCSNSITVPAHQTTNQHFRETAITPVTGARLYQTLRPGNRLQYP